MEDPVVLVDRHDDVETRFFGKGIGRLEEELPERFVPAELARAWLRQVHSAEVLEARPGLVGEADALASGARELALIVATADCVPILLAGATRIAAVHAGWRGLVAGVVPRALERLAEPVRRAWIGPAIGPCCYEVGEEVAAAVAGATVAAALEPRPSGRPHLDLRVAAAAQLARAGIAAAAGERICTRCDPRFWSHRRDGAAAGRNLALIWRRRAGTV